MTVRSGAGQGEAKCTMTTHKPRQDGWSGVPARLKHCSCGPQTTPWQQSTQGWRLQKNTHPWVGRWHYTWKTSRTCARTHIQSKSRQIRQESGSVGSWFHGRGGQQRKETQVSALHWIRYTEVRQCRGTFTPTA